MALDKLYRLKDKWERIPLCNTQLGEQLGCYKPLLQIFRGDTKIIYTPYIIEGLNRQFRMVTKSKTIFPTDSSLEKMLYLASMDVIKKWTQRNKNWVRLLSQLMIQYPGRLESYI